MFDTALYEQRRTHGFRSVGGSFHVYPPRHIRQAARCLYRASRWYGLTPHQARAIAFQITNLP